MHVGTFMHMFWDYPFLHTFWKSVLEIIHQTTGISLKDNPVALFLHFPPMLNKRYKKSMHLQLLNATKAYIPSMWQSTSPLTVRHGFARVDDIQEIEDFSVDIKERTLHVNKKWFYWNDFKYPSNYNQLP